MTDESANSGSDADAAELRDAWGDSGDFYALQKDGTLYHLDRSGPTWDASPSTTSEITDIEFRDIWRDDSGLAYLAGGDTAVGNKAVV